MTKLGLCCGWVAWTTSRCSVRRADWRPFFFPVFGALLCPKSRLQADLSTHSLTHSPTHPPIHSPTHPPTHQSTHAPALLCSNRGCRPTRSRMSSSWRRRSRATWQGQGASCCVLDLGFFWMFSHAFSHACSSYQIGVHAYRMLSGACNPMLRPIHVFFGVLLLLLISITLTLTPSPSPFPGAIQARKGALHVVQPLLRRA